MARLLVDTNVLLDVTLRRENLWEESAKILSLPSQYAACKLFIPAHAIPTFIYICKRNHIPEPQSCEIITKLLHQAAIGALDEAAVIRGIGMGFLDTEDAFVAAIAENVHANYIITRNVRDFRQSPVPAMTPEDYLSR